MHEISCPHCHKSFEIDKSGYTEILKQIMIQHIRQKGSILFSSHVRLNLKITRRIILKKITDKFNFELLDKWESFK